MQHLYLAVKHFKEYDEYCAIDKQNQEKVDFPLKRGEVKVILNALTMYANDFESKVYHRIDIDTYGRLPIEATLIADLLQKVQTIIYGEPSKRRFADILEKE